MRAIARIALIAAILLTLIGNAVVTGSSGSAEEFETIEIFMSSNAALIRAGLVNSPAAYFRVLNLTNLPQSYESVQSITLSFIKVLNWRNQYYYFLSGIWYDDTGIKEVPTSSIVLRVSWRNGAKSPADEGRILGALSRYFYTTFYEVDFSNGGSTYVSPYDHVTVFKRVEALIDTNVAVFRWVAFKALEYKDFYNVTIALDVLRNLASVFSSYTEYKVGGISVLSELVSWSPLYNYARPIHLTISSRFSSITYFPDVLNVSVVDPNSLYVKLSTILRGNVTSNPFSVDVKHSLPHLILEREFNTTAFNYGALIKVTLKISNVGAYEARNVILRESRWWDGENIVFIRGVTEESYAFILPNTSRIIEYIVKVNTSSPLDVKVPPAFATAEFQKNVFLNVTSPENVLHLNRPAPFLVPSLTVKWVAFEVGREYDYTIKVTNYGSVQTGTLRVGDYIVKGLGHGESRSVIITVAVKSASDLVKDLGSTVSYEFEGRDYTIATSRVKALFRSTEIMGPAVYVYARYSLHNGSYVNSTVLISNLSPMEIRDIHIVGRILYNLVPVKYDGFTIINETTFSRRLSLGRGESKEFSMLYRLKDVKDIAPYPLIKAYATHNGFLFVRNANFDVIYHNSILAKCVFPEGPLLTNKDYEVKCIVSNLACSVSVYNVSLVIKPDSRYVSVTLINPSVEVIQPNQSATFNATLRGLRSGNYTIPDISVSFVLGGVVRAINLPPESVRVVYGLSVSASLSETSILEGRIVTLSLLLSSDAPTLISNVTIRVKLPGGLLFDEGSSEYLKVMPSMDSERMTITLRITNTPPGEYVISDISVSYCFAGEPVKVPIPSPLVLRVSENFLQRYGAYVLISFIVPILIAVYVRRAVLSA